MYIDVASSITSLESKIDFFLKNAFLKKSNQIFIALQFI